MCLLVPYRILSPFFFSGVFSFDYFLLICSPKFTSHLNVTKKELIFFLLFFLNKIEEADLSFDWDEDDDDEDDFASGQLKFLFFCYS